MRLLAIDGNSIMNRAFYGIRLLSNSKGFFTNALTGFMNIYLKELETVKPDCVAAAFDLKAPTFRHKAVSSYKANRKGMPDELGMQMPMIKQILEELGVTVLEQEGYEADDILGTLSDIFSKDGSECFILTGDRDSFQLIRDNVTVRLASTGETKVYTPDRIMEEYGVAPEQMIDVKALMGDSSDNISGVKGIGEKTALSLIKRFGNIDRLFDEFADSDLSNGVKAKLLAGKEQAFESRFLGTIVLDAPIGRDINSYRPAPADLKALSETLSELEMFKLLEKLGLKFSEEKDGGQSTLFDLPKIDMPEIEVKELTAAYTEQIKKAGNDIYFIFRNEENVYLEIMYEDKIYFTDNAELIINIFESKNLKLCFEGKQAYKFAFSSGAELFNIAFICDLAGYLLKSQASDYSVESLCATYKAAYRRDMGKYADIASLKSLCSRLKAEIELKEMQSLLYEVEQPLCEVLASMECAGVKVDKNGVEEFGEGLKNSIETLQRNIYELAGKEFNISSPKQLGAVLFEDLSLPYKKKKTKSGYSTNAEVLESLIDTHPIVSMILEYRTLTKLSSTYVDGLLKLVRDDGRVHSVFKQTETRTGRISSTEPNMQNIPVRKELGRNMRKFFRAEEGNVLIDADYSQIELRVMAAVSGDENMQAAFINGEDIHTSTAAKVFDMPEDFVTPEMRRTAKAVNFGIIYGIGAFSLSKDIGVSVAKAKDYINDYFSHYPGIKKFLDKTVEDGMNCGYVTTVFGRRRYIPELTASNKTLQAFGKRAAMNAPIQGAAADIIKIAMVKVYQRLKAERLDARLILQVHDELIIEASQKDKERAKEILGEEMTNAVKLDVPLTADVNEGVSWYDAKG